MTLASLSPSNWYSAWGRMLDSTEKAGDSFHRAHVDGREYLVAIERIWGVLLVVGGCAERGTGKDGPGREVDEGIGSSRWCEPQQAMKL
jgi:hypothetical protein